MTKDKERDDAMIAEAAEMFPPDTVDVQSRYVIVHQLRASADIQDAQTKRETGWADTSDRACLMRKAADTLDALLHKLQPASKPDRAYLLASDVLDLARTDFNSEDLDEREPEAAALIRQQSTLIAALEWRPISTWPGTDEAYALVCNAGSVYPIIAGYDSNDEEWFSFNGYYEKFGKGPLVPDYWMPLPIPPATEALGKGSE